MYILDTNVLSELMRKTAEPRVLAWLDGVPPHQLFTSAITKAEIELGIALLPKGKRRATLEEQAKAVFAQDFLERCLPFDIHCAAIYANLVALRTQGGRPVSIEDAQIAAICINHGYAIVTRNIADFADIINLRMVNPWEIQA